MKNNVFIYYDNKHIVGTDIKNQPYKMRGLMTINKYNKYSDVAQGGFRLRNMNYGHEIYFILDENVNNINNRSVLVKYLLDKDTKYKNNSKYKLLLQNVLKLGRILGDVNTLEQYNEYENKYKNKQEYIRKVIIKPHNNSTYNDLCVKLLETSIENNNTNIYANRQVAVEVEEDVEADVEVNVEAEVQIEIQTSFDYDRPEKVKMLNYPTLQNFNSWKTIESCVSKYSQAPKLFITDYQSFSFYYFRINNYTTITDPIVQMKKTKCFVNYNKYYIKYKQEDKYIILNDYISCAILAHLNYFVNNDNIVIMTNNNKVIFGTNNSITTYDSFINLLFGSNSPLDYEAIYRSPEKNYLVQIMLEFSNTLSLLPWYSLDIINDKFDKKKYITMHYDKKIDMLKKKIQKFSLNLNAMLDKLLEFHKNFVSLAKNDNYSSHDIKIKFAEMYKDVKVIIDAIVTKNNIAKSVLEVWSDNIEQIDEFTDFTYIIYYRKRKLQNQKLEKLVHKIKLKLGDDNDNTSDEILIKQYEKQIKKIRKTKKRIY